MKGESIMNYETIKTVNGIAIKRHIGTKFPYYVCLTGEVGQIGKAFYTFKTCKAAAEFIVRGY